MNNVYIHHCICASAMPMTWWMYIHFLFWKYNYFFYQDTAFLFEWRFLFYYTHVTRVTISVTKYVQAQSTRLVTLHSLWPTRNDIWRLSNILLKNISVTQNVRVLQTVNFLSSVHNLYPQLQWMRLETLLFPLSVPVVTWKWSRLSSTSMLIQIVSVYQCCFTLLMVVFHRASQQGWWHPTLSGLQRWILESG